MKGSTGIIDDRIGWRRRILREDEEEEFSHGTQVRIQVLIEGLSRDKLLVGIVGHGPGKGRTHHTCVIFSSNTEEDATAVGDSSTAAILQLLLLLLLLLSEEEEEDGRRMEDKAAFRATHQSLHRRHECPIETLRRRY